MKPAPSAGDVEEAKRYFDQGESLRAAKKYQAALEAYLKSRALVPRASNTVNVAVCLFNLERYDEAYEYFEEALTKFSDDQLPKPARDAAKSSLATIETKVGRIAVSPDARGTLVVDGRTRGELPLSAPLRVMPGRHVVRVLREGAETFEQILDVKVETTTTIYVNPEAHTTTNTMRTVAIVTAVTGVAVVGVGGILGLRAKSSYDDAKSAHCSAGICDADGKRLTDDAYALGNKATLIVGIGAAVVAGGVILWVASPSTGPKPGVTSVGIGPATISITGSF